MIRACYYRARRGNRNWGSGVKRFGAVLAVACTIACALVSSTSAHAQEPRDPLIDPPEGGRGSRFQVVGQVNWIPGESVRLRIAFAESDPFSFTGPFPYEQPVTVLRDATWSFPIVVTDDVLGFALPDTPGYLVVRAESATNTTTNVYVYTVGGQRPPGAEEIANLGFGLAPAGAGSAIGLALFIGGTGALLLASGALRRHSLV